jgi:signal peptidase II
VSAGFVPRSWKVLALCVVVLGVVLDLWSKAWMQDHLAMDPGHPDATLRKDIVPGFFGLEGTWNPGVTFGFFRGKTRMILWFTVAAIVGLFLWLWFSRVRSRTFHLGLSFVLAGAIGNLYDRWNWQKVRDFLLVYVGEIENPSWKWPNFNVADSLIVVGVGLILWEELFGRRRRERREREGTPVVPAGAGDA